MMSRHMACKTCRDRKVRCPGGQPVCEKCKRSGDACIYISPSKQSKANIAQTVEILQERLAKAEAQLQEVRAFHPDHVVSETANEPPTQVTSLRFPPTPMGFAMQRPTSSSVSESMSMPTPSFSYGTSHMMPDSMALVSPITAFSPAPNIPDSHPFLESLPMTIPTSRASDGWPSDDFLVPTSPFPSLRDLRALNANPDQQSQHPSRDDSKETSPLVLELATFSSAILLAQADAAGMSSVLADYLRWAKKFAQPNMAMVSILETLEVRAYEVSGICSANPGPSLERLASVLGNNTSDAVQWKEAAKRLQDHMSNKTEFFHSAYDPDLHSHAEGMRVKE
ncbi:hypothetical protein K504DRAFT_453747 [Pleomassaria siparia CBS 279.74]|uniref:Zn(2)-C6 fungal-type domain-containing protein n=1 Tax=Pleomassaria siparia CBS 279.74 TaxID=1314801 RepID=A0A6G1KDG1_9PLEO|nr:hypothetical protein K504DRAFT_453747 [Pleomassaria siparia CBS 279.74]